METARLELSDAALREKRAGNPMIDLILRDSDLRPDLFGWRGGIPPSEIEKWEREQSLRVPDDLRELWAIKGEGDLFESETITPTPGA